MKRREFISLVGGAAAWPLAARGQQTKVYRIGALFVGNGDLDFLRTAADRAYLWGLKRQTWTHCGTAAPATAFCTPDDF